MSNFTLTNTPTCGGDIPNGSVFSSDGGNSAVLTGSNSGSGCAAATDLVTPAQASGIVHFQYTYASLDSPGADSAGYLLNSRFTQLADTGGQSGTAMFAVTQGQSFGFRVATDDNTGEPGVLTISNFNAPAGTAAVPEPGTAALALAGAFAALAGKRAFARNRRPKRLGLSIIAGGKA